MAGQVWDSSSDAVVSPHFYYEGTGTEKYDYVATCISILQFDEIQEGKRAQKVEIIMHAWAW